MTDQQNPTTGLAAPRPPKTAPAQNKAGLMSRVGRLFGSGDKADADQALVLRQSLSAKLPNTDPLRAARLQTHLFLGQLPAFPTPQDDAGSASTAPNTRADTPTHDDGDLAHLRAEKQTRDTAKAEAAKAEANDPARQRVNSLRERRRQELDARNRRAASAPTRAPAQATSRETQAAAARSPARKALSQAAMGNGATVTNTGGGKGRSGNAMNGILLLLALITLFLIVAGIFWGYSWYQSQNSDPDPIDDPAVGLFDPIGNPVGGTDPDASTPPLAVPTQPEQPVPSTTPEQPAVPDADPTRVEDQLRQTTILLLEQRLNSTDFLTDATDVDGVYDANTLRAIREFASTIVDTDLADEVLRAGLQPTREQLERWRERLGEFF